MADTDKQNFRYPAARWKLAQEKAADMRAAGYDVDLTLVLRTALDEFIKDDPQVVAKGLKVRQQKSPAPAYRKPFPRGAASA